MAISICGANEALTTQITRMLKYTEIIDECDTLGQELAVDNTIHNVRLCPQPTSSDPSSPALVQTLTSECLGSRAGV